MKKSITLEEAKEKINSHFSQGSSLYLAQAIRDADVYRRVADQKLEKPVFGKPRVTPTTAQMRDELKKFGYGKAHAGSIIRRLRIKSGIYTKEFI